MLEYITVTRVKAHAIDNTGMTFGIVNDHIMTAAEHINDAYHTLVTKIEEAGIFFPFKFGQFFFELLVKIGIAAHHAGSHRGGQSVLFGSVGIRLPDLRVIGQTEVVIQTPYNYFLSAEFHPAADFPFQFG